MSVFWCRCFCFEASWGVTGINSSVSVPTEPVKGVPSVKSTKKALWVTWRALSIVPEASLQLQESRQKGRARTLRSFNHEMCLTPSHPPFTPSTPRNRPERTSPERWLSARWVTWLCNPFTLPIQCFAGERQRGRGDRSPVYRWMSRLICGGVGVRNSLSCFAESAEAICHLRVHRFDIPDRICMAVKNFLHLTSVVSSFQKFHNKILLNVIWQLWTSIPVLKIHLFILWEWQWFCFYFLGCLQRDVSYFKCTTI